MPGPVSPGSTGTDDVVPFREAVRAWFAISLQTFGGPAGQIAVMQRELVEELVAGLLEGGPDLLERPFADDWTAAPDDAARLRVVVDQVASLTDASAVAWHARVTSRVGSRS